MNTPIPPIDLNPEHGAPPPTATVVTTPDGRISICVNVVVNACCCSGAQGASVATAPDDSQPWLPPSPPVDPTSVPHGDNAARRCVNAGGGFYGALGYRATCSAGVDYTSQQLTDWNQWLFCNNPNNAMTDYWHVATFFFRHRPTDSLLEGFVVLPSSSGNAQYGVVRPSSTNTNTLLAMDTLGLGADMADTYTLTATASRLGGIGTTATFTLHTNVAPPAGSHVVVMPATVDRNPNTVTHYQSQGSATLVNGTMVGGKYQFSASVNTACAARYHCFLVDRNPASTAGPSATVISNVTSLLV